MKISIKELLEAIRAKNDFTEKEYFEIAEFAIDYSNRSQTVFKIAKYAKDAADRERY